jgi:hypothetical protein
MFMHNFNSLAATQTHITKFWNFSKKISENFRKFLSEVLKIPKLSMQFLVFTSKAYSCQISAIQLLSRRTLNFFLIIFQVNFRIFQGNSQAKSKINQIWVFWFMLQLTNHVHAKFQPTSFYPDNFFRQIFDHFSS